MCQTDLAQPNWDRLKPLQASNKNTRVQLAFRRPETNPDKPKEGTIK